MTVVEILESLGVKAPSLVAGLAGGAASLTFQKNIGWLRALVLIITGAVCAGYLTPLAVDYVAADQRLEGAYAFLIGLLSMHIIGGLISLGERFQDNPGAFLKIFRNSDKDAAAR